jgi:3'-phosphoadenosine 5'-phosphosulfate sulfotransferase (PAPS reductase)/FAD synthetase
MSEIRHIVALSGGKDSTAMALRLMEVEPRNYEFAITPTGRELPVMTSHWERLECLLGKRLTRVPGPTLIQSIVKNKALPNWRMRFCTRETKIEPFMAYAAAAAPAVCYVGIRADEAEDRDGTNWKGLDGVTQDLPLLRWGWGVAKVKEYLRARDVSIPARTDCDCCFFQQLAEWWRLWRDHKDRWQEIEALELWSGHTLRSDGRDSWPAGLAELRKTFEAGIRAQGRCANPTADRRIE